MNRKTLTALILAGVTGVLAQTTAFAGSAERHAVSGNELQRCVVALRGEAAETGAASVRHTVTGEQVRGLWREFTIESTFAAAGGQSLGGTVTRCRTERWGDATTLDLVARRDAAAVTLAQADRR